MAASGLGVVDLIEPENQQIVVIVVMVMLFSCWCTLSCIVHVFVLEKKIVDTAVAKSLPKG